MTIKQAEELASIYRIEVPGSMLGYIKNLKPVVGDEETTEEVSIFIRPLNCVPMHIEERLKSSPVENKASTIFSVTEHIIRLKTNSYEEALLFIPIFKHYTA